MDLDIKERIRPFGNGSRHAWTDPDFSINIAISIFDLVQNQKQITELQFQN
jgi:hypothetical protein